MGDRKEKGAKKAKTDKSGWPVIKPKHNLQITRLKDNDLFVVENLFSSTESKAFVRIAELAGFSHQGSLGPAKGEAYRDNDRISVNDPDLAQMVWDCGLSTLLNDLKVRGKVAVGLNSNIRFYRYKVGQHFGRHIDESVDLGGGKRTRYTLLIYLSGGGEGEAKTKGKNDGKNQSDTDPLIGGETVFYDSRNRTVAEVAPKEGMALLHVHGDKCMLHEALTVTKGLHAVKIIVTLMMIGSRV